MQRNDKFHGIHVICTILFFQNTDTRVAEEKEEERRREVAEEKEENTDTRVAKISRIVYGIDEQNIIEDRLRPRGRLVN